MTYEPLDPAKTAVLFTDLQDGIIERTVTHELSRLRGAASARAQLARLFDLPVIVTAAPSGGAAPRITPEIAEALGELPTYVRTTTDAFTHAATREAILRTGRSTLLIAGVATEIIVQHSALSGLANGLATQIVVDACGGLSARTEDAALRRLAHAGVATTTIASVAGQLAGDLSQERGRRALEILYSMA